MRKISALLLIFLSTTCLGGPVNPGGAVPSLQVGGRTFTDLSNLIILATSCTSTNNCALRKNGGTAGYQVTAGKTLHIYAVRVLPSGASSCAPTLEQCDNDVGVNTATACTNPVQLYGTTGLTIASPASSGSPTTIDIDMPIASAKFAVFSSPGNTCVIFAYGYEK